MVKRRHAVAALLCLLLAACGTARAEQARFIDLSERVEVPAEGTGEVAPLNIAVAAILSPEGTIESYARFAAYVSRRLDRPVEILQRRTYQEINDLLESGEADVGFVCTSAYVRGADEFGLRLLAAPQIRGQTVYYSELIVPTDSTVQSMTDLRGATFAFTDPMSMSGRAYPTHVVAGLGETPESFFGSIIFTYSHEKAIESVAAGIADGAAVDSLVLAYVLARQPDLGVRVVDRSPPFGIPPVVVSPQLTPTMASELQALLFSIAADPLAAPVLADLGIDRFVAVDDSAYDGVRAIAYIVELTS